MQNKPNVPDAQMNASSVLTKDYENKRLADVAKTKPIQSQYKPNTNPIPEKPKMNLNFYSTKDYENKRLCRCGQNKPNLLAPQMNVTSYITKDYENERLRWARKTKPIQTQFQKGTCAAQIFLNVSPHFLNIFERFQTFLNVFILPNLPYYCSLTPTPPFLPHKSRSHPKIHPQKTCFFQIQISAKISLPF